MPTTSGVNFEQLRRHLNELASTELTSRVEELRIKLKRDIEELVQPDASVGEVVEDEHPAPTRERQLSESL